MKKALEVINELKKKGLIDAYAIGGGIATLFYIEPFLTYDLDVFIILSEKKEEENLISLSPVFDYLKKKGYSFKGEHVVIEGIPVQFIPADELEKVAIRSARKIEYEKIKTRVFEAEYLIAILLRAGRKKDMNKIEKLVEETKIEGKKLEEILKRYGLMEKFKLLRKGIYGK